MKSDGYQGTKKIFKGEIEIVGFFGHKGI